MEQHTIVWRGVQIEITVTPEAFGMVDHIELRTESRAPLPVTETGYRSHFTHKGTVTDYGGAVAFVTAWLDHEAKRTGWRGAQLSLF
ncbi:MAG: hypothetical protein H5U24_19035 [Thioclava marina]|uniref:hypothetical protein n=1 Tax=Thioclava marina TaxID=1915077 RepID=UPI00198410BF|nr:hypothetical protein [Thioclava marina]MBC7147463.1 hypothetical protein [Thioclava marina]